MNQQELAGYQLFKNTGCVACHSGPAVGGTSYQKLGLMKLYLTQNKATGRAAVTGNDNDMFVFKVPTLCNIDKTYPYFHDSSVWDLEKAVNIMAEIQLGRELSQPDSQKIVAFLKSLTGDQPSFSLPQLPASRVDTPRPDPR